MFLINKSDLTFCLRRQLSAVHCGHSWINPLSVAIVWKVYYSSVRINLMYSTCLFYVKQLECTSDIDVGVGFSPWNYYVWLILFSIFPFSFCTKLPDIWITQSEYTSTCGQHNFSSTSRIDPISELKSWKRMRTLHVDLHVPNFRCWAALTS